MKANLCKCNNCDSILLDQNPQIGAKEYELKGTEIAMQYETDENGGFWTCPICETDAYLNDL
jgi:hypothetical protein